MAAVITPRGSAANAVPHNASNTPTDLPYINMVGGNIGQNRGTAPLSIRLWGGTPSPVGAQKASAVATIGRWNRISTRV